MTTPRFLTMVLVFVLLIVAAVKLLRGKTSATLTLSGVILVLTVVLVATEPVDR